MIVTGIEYIDPGAGGATSHESGREEDEVRVQEGGGRHDGLQQTRCQEGAEKERVVEVEDASWFIESNELGVWNPCLRKVFKKS